MSGDKPQATTAIVEAPPLSEEDAALARLQTNRYVPDVKHRVRKMTTARKRTFCEALAKGASPTAAAKLTDVARSTVYAQRKNDPEFREAWDDALERVKDLYEDRLHELATNGNQTLPVIVELKHRRPEMWQDKQEIVQRSVNVHVSLPAVTEAELLSMVQKRIAEGQALLPPGGPDTKLPSSASNGSSQREGS